MTPKQSNRFALVVLALAISIGPVAHFFKWFASLTSSQ